MATQPKEHIAATLLQRAHSPDTATTILHDKVKQRPLLLRPTSPDPALNARSKRQHERFKKQKLQRKSKKPKPLSAKQKRALCLYDIPKEQQKYAIYEPLHTMWCKYMRDILGLADGRKSYIEPNDAGPFIASADYHGGGIEVVRSRCNSRVGLRGIVVKDTKFTFEIVTRQDVVKVVPKEGTVFRFEVPLKGQKGDAENDDKPGEKKPLIFEVLGSQFEQRAPDRANKKFRMHLDPDL